MRLNSDCLNEMESLIRDIIEIDNRERESRLERLATLVRELEDSERDKLREHAYFHIWSCLRCVRSRADIVKRIGDWGVASKIVSLFAPERSSLVDIAALKLFIEEALTLPFHQGDELVEIYLSLLTNDILPSCEEDVIRDGLFSLCETYISFDDVSARIRLNDSFTDYLNAEDGAIVYQRISEALGSENPIVVELKDGLALVQNMREHGAWPPKVIRWS